MSAPWTDPSERLLVDPVLDAVLARSGMVTVPLVDPGELAVIEDQYWRMAPSEGQEIVLDYLRSDRRLVRELDGLMRPLWERVLPGVFEHHYPVYTSFVLKNPGEHSHLFLHRDLCVDDERIRRTLSMWMPFTDTGPDLDNGPVSFVAGSHEIRYGAFGPNAVGLFAPYDKYLEEMLEPVAVPTGTAVVYDARMLHASAPNRSDRPRLAVGCLLARRDQPVVQVMATGRRHRVVHEVGPAYFVDYGPAEIAATGMPDAFAVVDEFDEEPGLNALEVLGPALGAGAGSRAVIVPTDLEEMAGARSPLPVRNGRAPEHQHDLRITAADLATWRPSPMRGVEVNATGAVGAIELVRAFRPIQPVPAAVPDVATSLGPLYTRDAALAVVDAGGRLTVTAGGGRHRTEAIVLECPAVRSGVGAQDQVAELDLGTVVPLKPETPLVFWNSGPGPLVLLLRRQGLMSTIDRG